jgi:hypothetical protein
MSYCYDEIELAYDSPVDSDDPTQHEEAMSIEDWQDWNSEELLNLWMSIVQYHEEWYLPLRKTFNEFCEFVFRGLDNGSPLDNFTYLDSPPEIQAIKNHPFVKGLDWNLFFFSRH